MILILLVWFIYSRIDKGLVIYWWCKWGDGCKKNKGITKRWWCVVYLSWQFRKRDKKSNNSKINILSMNKKPNDSSFQGVYKSLNSIEYRFNLELKKRIMIWNEMIKIEWLKSIADQAKKTKKPMNEYWIDILLWVYPLWMLICLKKYYDDDDDDD